MKAVFREIVTRHALRGQKDQAPGSGQKIVSCKVLGTGKPLADDQLAKINRFARKPLTAEEVFHVPILLGHNGIDRDNERFHEDLLKDFARTLVGKGFFVAGHPSSWSGTGGPGEGKYFDASVDQMTPAQFKDVTGEDIILPEGADTVHALMTHAYMLKLASNEDARKNIDGGIFSFASIGFQAPYFNITDDLSNHKYGEYRPKGEALEGSLVWLGAQPGAGVTKNAAGAPQTPAHGEPKGDMDRMEKQLLIIGTKLGRTFTTEKFAEEILALIGEKDAANKSLTDQVASLTLDAADGKAFRKGLIEDTIKAGVLLEEIKTDEASQQAEEKYLMTVPIDRLKAMASRAMAAARKQFPDKYEIPAPDQTRRDQDNKDASAAAAAPGGTNAGAGKPSLSEEAKKRAEAGQKK